MVNIILQVGAILFIIGCCSVVAYNKGINKSNVEVAFIIDDIIKAFEVEVNND